MKMQKIPCFYTPTQRHASQLGGHGQIRTGVNGFADRHLSSRSRGHETGGSGRDLTCCPQRVRFHLAVGSTRAPAGGLSGTPPKERGKRTSHARKWWAVRESNPQPSEQESAALPVAPTARETMQAGSPARSASQAVARCWRRERDSNPRGACAPTTFPGWRLRPLGHPSI